MSYFENSIEPFFLGALKMVTLLIRSLQTVLPLYVTPFS